jgi:very-short-patch-repair endonuclease
MNGKEKLTPDVMCFLNKCSEAVGNHENEMFNQDNWCFVLDNEVRSPIEQILYFAFETLRYVNGYVKDEPQETPNGPIIVGAGMTPQFKIGEYRVDFLAVYGGYPRHKDWTQYKKEVVVECDSQEFHERTESERRYEKKRDRYLQSRGYKVFRFTGKEIKDKPFETAAEILSYLTGEKTENLLNDDFLQK